MVNKKLSVKEIEEKIVTALEAGVDTTDMVKQLVKAQHTIEGEKQKERLSQMAELRTGYRSAAAKLVQEIKEKDGSVERFLSRKEGLLQDIGTLMSKLEEWQKLEVSCLTRDECSSLRWAAEKIPAKYLPPGLTVEVVTRNDEGRILAADHQNAETVLYLLQQARSVITGVIRYDESIKGDPCLRDDVLQPQVEASDSRVNYGNRRRIIEPQEDVTVTDQINSDSDVDFPVSPENHVVEHITLPDDIED